MLRPSAEHLFFNQFKINRHKLMIKLPSFVLLLATTLTLVSCGTSKRNQDQKEDTLAISQNELDKTPITEKYWKLVTLEGQKVSMAPNQEREVHFMLKTDQNLVRGFAGCNTFNGTYILEKGQRIRFSPLAATLKACPDVDVNEAEFFKVFELADNYSINGDTLSLNVGRRAPLAVFEAVYF